MNSNIFKLVSILANGMNALNIEIAINEKNAKNTTSPEHKTFIDNQAKRLKDIQAVFDMLKTME